MGIEIQNDAIGSGNSGLPDEVICVPNNLVPAERQRFYKEMLQGFRYCRLAMGLYFRGLDAEKKHVIERYPNQLNDLREMMRESGMEGLSMEYWSPAPAWKTTLSYLGGTLKSTSPAFLNEFGDALVQDIQYMKKNGLNISMWGMQNEPILKTVGNLAIGNAPKQSYSHCSYTPEMYMAAFKIIAPKVRNVLGKGLIITDTWEGNNGEIGKLLQADTSLLKYVASWVYHRIGSNSNQMIEESSIYKANAFSKPVFQNKFEYQHPTSDKLCINTAQNVMNWFTFADSPTWFWLHALKPTYNAEASGYCLGFWRPENDNDTAQFNNIKKGHWDYNDKNFNALAGFLKHMPWDSRRYEVEEDVVRKDNRILVFKTPKGKTVIVLTNRSGKPFTFKIQTGSKKKFKGYRYTPSSRQADAGNLSGKAFTPTLPDLSIEFWVEE